MPEYIDKEIFFSKFIINNVNVVEKRLKIRDFNNRLDVHKLL